MNMYHLHAIQMQQRSAQSTAQHRQLVYQAQLAQQKQQPAQRQGVDVWLATLTDPLHDLFRPGMRKRNA